MGVELVVRCRLPGMSLREFRRFAAEATALLGEGASEVVVSLVGEREIHRLNARYRGKDRPTDVLAFATREGERMPGGEQLLGDIVIGVPVARRQAVERGRSLAEELRVLFVHGLLHLLGYDHERSPAEARRMRRKELWVLARATPQGSARLCRGRAAPKGRRRPLPAASA